MAKRAEETKKKQTIAEKPRLEAKTAKSQEENKENINLAPPPAEQESEKPQQPEVESLPEPPLPAAEPPKDETPVEPQPQPAPTPAPAPEAETEPVPETQPETQPEPEPEPQAEPSKPEPEHENEAELQHAAEEAPIPAIETKPESTTDTSVSAPDAEPSSVTSASPSAEISTSTEKFETALESAQSETPQAVPEDETLAETIDSAALDQNETKDNLVPPSASDEVPLDTESTEIPDATPPTEDASDAHQAEVVSANPEQSEPATVESVPAAPEPAQFPVTPPADITAAPEEEPALAPVSVSIDPAPLDEGTTEESPVEKQNLLPLDQRRRIHLEPIQVPTPEYSDDDNLLSDDSFMEELRSATVQEARPVSVKTPNGGDSWGGSRAVSSPHMASPPAMQSMAAGRSVSSSYPDNGPPTPVLVAKKINVSSGISNRIKALEKFSSREGTPSSGSHTVNGPSASSSFENLRKRASVSYASPEAFSRATGIDSRPTLNGARRTNSISVTARIVRDSGLSPGSNGTEPPESDVLNLQASPLTVEHSADEPSVNGEPGEPINHSEDRSMSVSSTGSGRPAAPASRPGSRLSLSSRSRTDETVHTTSTVEEKKESRASRLMRRMSSITSTSRRSIIGTFSPPVKEEDTNPVNESTVSQISSGSFKAEPIDIGEVNVQFPETLLWKRRFMRIDEDGFLVLTPGTNDASARNMTKRYHLTEFRTPCLPDEDMQELPNSILLDFLDGSTLQCACESRQGQSAALQSKFLIALSWSHDANEWNSSCRCSQRPSTISLCRLENRLLTSRPPPHIFIVSYFELYLSTHSTYSMYTFLSPFQQSSHPAESLQASILSHPSSSPALFLDFCDIRGMFVVIPQVKNSFFSFELLHVQGIAVL